MRSLCKTRLSSAAAFMLGCLWASSSASACTGIRLIAEDGTVVPARTLEFAMDIHSNIIVVPRGFARIGTTPDGKEGLKWTSKYASVGANGLGMPVIFDGVNEKGLYIGLFYFPGFAEYMKYSPSDANKTIAPTETGSWILENFATIDEVKHGLKSIVVGPVVYKPWGFVLPGHYVVHDASGKSIVIEYVGGKLQVHDNPLGIVTNAPTFDWHMLNLRNYVNLSPVNVPPVHLGSITLNGFGKGTGMLGLPGDFTPPSRFVRAAMFSTSALPSKTGDEAVLQAFHILNAFDIPKGAARDDKKDERGNITADYTAWTSASDLNKKRFYFRTYENSHIRSIELMTMNLKAKDIVTISMKGEEVITDITP